MLVSSASRSSGALGGSGCCRVSSAPTAVPTGISAVIEAGVVGLVEDGVEPVVVLSGWDAV
ncbi:hypothetical protein [Streptomyces sp. SA3_actF]|uniref:hypothetical protein n=1 Tax=Streptomyces sp. SA3_actF TaxID=682181 RepID=UPI00020009AA